MDTASEKPEIETAKHDLQEVIHKKSEELISLKRSISNEIVKISNDLNQMEVEKNASIEQLEAKKVELRKYGSTNSICDEHMETIQEIARAQKLIEDRQESLTALDTLVADLNNQIAAIQEQHNKALYDLEQKKKNLSDLLKYLDDLNDKLSKLKKMLTNEELQRCLEIHEKKKQKLLMELESQQKALDEGYKKILISYAEEEAPMYDYDYEKFRAQMRITEILEAKGEKLHDIKLKSEYSDVEGETITICSESSESEYRCKEEINYLKLIFKSILPKALAEITAVQPKDPVTYLAHYMLKYRRDQEIDEIKRKEIQDLIVEQERIAAEKLHAEIEEEAKLAVLEALFRAENFLKHNQFLEYYGEYE